MKSILASFLVFFLLVQSSRAQETARVRDTPNSERYGNTLNVGLGLRPYTSYNYISPALHLNYEIDLTRNLTIAPFISLYSYRNNYYWGGPNHPYRNYGYRQTIVPVGAKVSYYFDELLKAHADWDFYLAGSGGILFRTITWDNDYYGERTAVSSSARLYLAFHVGAEYHLNQKIGLFVDLSTSVSTFGIAFHL